MKEGHCGACLVIPLNFWVKPLVTRIVTKCTIECRYTYISLISDVQYYACLSVTVTGITGVYHYRYYHNAIIYACVIVIVYSRYILCTRYM